MPITALWLAAIGPAALILAGFARRGSGRPASARATGGTAIAAAIVSCAVAGVTGIAVLLGGTMRTPTIGVAGIGFSLYLDALSGLMYALVSFIGAIVMVYSRNYLDGDPGQSRFMRRLALTLAAVLMLVISGNLLQLALAWLATSLGLHGLLVFYRERPSATLAARKKFVLSRLGELLLVAALLIIYRHFGSLDYSVVSTAAESLRASGLVPRSIDVACALLVGAALLKSAQFPLHGWLIEVMETPTPVSALLHAGIINAGGFLILRLAGLISLSSTALDLMLIFGALTALFGSLVMLTQTSVKVSLAYSTIAQMGFMMLECGLGAFSAAMLHLTAHSLYKAHAFLSSGSVIDIFRASMAPAAASRPHPARLVIAILVALGMLLGFGLVFGVRVSAEPGVFALGAIVLLGLVHLIASSVDEHPSTYVIARAVVLAALVALAYFGLQWCAERLFAGVLPPTAALRGPLDGFIVACVLVAFAALTLFQSALAGTSAPSRWDGLYAHASHGFYVNTIANRCVLRLWPAGMPGVSLSGQAAAANGIEAGQRS